MKFGPNGEKKGVKKTIDFSGYFFQKISKFQIIITLRVFRVGSSDFTGSQPQLEILISLGHFWSCSATHRIYEVECSQGLCMSFSEKKKQIFLESSNDQIECPKSIKNVRNRFLMKIYIDLVIQFFF